MTIKPFLFLLLKIQEDILLMDKKRNISAGFSELKTKNPFQVPENYFDEFEARLKEKIKHETPINRVNRGTFRVAVYIKYSVAAAAIIAGFFIVNNLINKPVEPEFRNEEIAVMLQEDIYDLDGSELETGISQSAATEEVSISTENQLYKEAIIEYLVDEQIDLETIVSQL